MDNTIQEFLGFLQVTPEEIPQEVTAKLADPTATLEEQKASLITWYNQRPVIPTPTVIPSSIATKFCTLDTSEKVAKIDQDIEYYFKEVDKLHARAHSYLSGNVRNLREDKLRLLLRSELDLTTQLNEVLRDPFWTYQEALTPGTVCFISAPVTMHHLTMKVPLGRFGVSLTASGLKVRPFNDPTHPNCILDGYCHPHISPGGEVCWGTAHELYTTGMRDFNFSQVFTALRSILTQYNPDSPYRELYRFALAKNLLDLSKYVEIFRKNDEYSTEWIPVDDLPGDFKYDWNEYEQEEYTDDDGDDRERIRLVEPWMRYIPDLDYWVNQEFYYKTAKGEFALWPE